MKKIMCVDYDSCTGCTTCQMVCSLSHEGECSPKKSRIQIVKKEEKAVYVPVVCKQCENPPCRTACPVGAIQQIKETGAMNIEQEVCNGCGLCLTSCPYGAVSLYSSKGTAFVCDLCDGKPKCVEVCPTGVLVFLAPHQFAARRRKTAAQDVVQTVLKSRNKSMERGRE